MPRSFVCATALVLALAPPAPSRAAGAYDPAVTWRTIESPRFAVHYPEGGRNLAVRAARIAEEALDDVGELFGYRPEGRIDIVLTDSSDNANGSAQVMPKNTVRLFLAAPTELNGLSSYDDWLRILIVHELAHICDLDQTWGLTRALRFVFGKYIAMNTYAPQLLSEGAAVWAETLLTPTGRGRSSYVAMLLRMAALEGRFLAIDQVHIQFSDWPGPNAAYFYGGVFHLWLTEHYGEEAVRALHQAYAANPVPYLYWPGAKLTFGKSLPELWDEWRAEEEGFAREIAAAALAQGVTPSKRLTFHGRNITGARYSFDGSFILYSRTSPVDGSTVRRVDRDGSHDRHLVLETFSPRFSFAPDGASFYYSQGAVNERFNDYNDLYRYELESDESVRLRDHARPETSLRARDPDIAPDGQRLVFVQNALEQSWLAVGTLTGEKSDELDVRVLVPPAGDMQHASPRFSPDGRTIAVSTWFPGGFRDVVLVDAESGALVRRVTNDAALDGNPAWSPDGRYLLYESDADGISNIYAFDVVTGRYARVTRVIGGAFQADVARDGRTMLFRDAAGIGFDIHEMPFAPQAWIAVTYDPARGYTEGAGARVATDAAWMHASLPEGAPRASERALALGPREHDEAYTPWPTLLPFHDNWLLLPALFIGYGNNPGFSLTTLGTDVLGRHTWIASAGSSLATRRLNWSAAYVNDVWYPTLSLAGGDNSVSYGTVAERTRALSTGVSLPVAQRHLASASFVRERREALTVETGDLTLGDVAYVQAGYRYRFTRRFPYSVGQEHGTSLGAALRWYSRPLGGDFDELLLTLDGRAYVNNPLFDNHVLALGVTAAIALGPEYGEKFLLGGAQADSIFTVSNERVYPLRGFAVSYPAEPGLLALYTEYRFPLWQVERGLWTLPVYLERLHAALFADAGVTFDTGGGPGLAELVRNELRGGRVGVGAEARADVSLGWEYPLTLRLGAGFPVVDGGRVRALGAPALYLSFGSAI